ncbi:glycosyltransferase group 1 family [Haloferula helveola]|uniref:Glycosyltransferase group 1 family n=1 Tax=Haloferula helveola TaxID=490095 RepID=A0ABM7RKR4_9BACT|nr:glycosyltransferase group 1 family [Haloferula helveola]
MNDVHSIAVISEILPLGGTSSFVLNLCRGMEHSPNWSIKVGALRSVGEVGSQIIGAGYDLVGPELDSVLHEERVEDLFRGLSVWSPQVVVASLGGGAFDFLRYVPEGCLRIGMIQSDDECVYRLVEKHLPWLDIIVGVSAEICRKMRLRLGDLSTTIIQQPYGVGMVGTAGSKPKQSGLRILYLGRVSEDQKRVNRMARIMKRTLEADPDLRWTIAGDGSDLGRMRREFDGVPRVAFTGALPYDRVAEVVTENDVYFLCSDFEGLPLSLLESMGAGLVPVVSNLASGISEVVDDGNGIRVDPGDEDAFVAAILGLAIDPERVREMSGRAAKRVRENYSAEAMARRWVTMVEEHGSGAEIVWAAECRASAPVELEGRFAYHRCLRPIRKMWKRLRQR